MIYKRYFFSDISVGCVSTICVGSSYCQSEIFR